MGIRSLNRWQASGGHFLFSAVLGVGIFLLFRFLWYPGALWELSGAGKLLLLVLGVDVVLGPLLTLIVFNPKKRELLIDLGLIVTVQIAALAYGLYVMAQSRPVFLVAAVDRLVVVSANEIEIDELQQAPEALRRLSWAGPVLVGARSDLRGDQQFKQIMDAITTGKDIERMPQFYRPYEETAETLLSRSRPFDDEAFIGKVDYPRFKKAFHDAKLDEKQVRVVLLSGRAGFGIMAIDSKSATPLASFPYDLF